MFVLPRIRQLPKRRRQGAGLQTGIDLRHNDVVKSVGAMTGTAPGDAGRSDLPAPATPAPAQATAGLTGSERGTRAQIARLILEHGPATATALSERLSLTPAAVRRHLDNLLAEGMIESRMARPYHGAAPAPGPPGPGVRAHRRRPQRLRARLRRPGGQRAALPGRAGRAGRGRRVRPAAGRRAGAALRRRWSPRPPPQTGCGRWPRRCPRTDTPRRRRARRWPAAASSFASTIARWRTSRPNILSCARPRRRPSAACSGSPCSGWPRSRTATASAPRTSPHRPC